MSKKKILQVYLVIPRSIGLLYMVMRKSLRPLPMKSRKKILATIMARHHCIMLLNLAVWDFASLLLIEFKTKILKATVEWPLLDWLIRRDFQKLSNFLNRNFHPNWIKNLNLFKNLQSHRSPLLVNYKSNVLYHHPQFWWNMYLLQLGEFFCCKTL